MCRRLPAGWPVKTSYLFLASSYMSVVGSGAGSAVAGRGPSVVSFRQPFRPSSFFSTAAGFPCAVARSAAARFAPSYLA